MNCHICGKALANKLDTWGQTGLEFCWSCFSGLWEEHWESSAFHWSDTTKGDVWSYSACAKFLECDCRLVAVVHYVRDAKLWHVFIFDEMGAENSWLINTESLTAVICGFLSRTDAQDWAATQLNMLITMFSSPPKNEVQS